MHDVDVVFARATQLAQNLFTNRIEIVVYVARALRTEHWSTELYMLTARRLEPLDYTRLGI